MIKPILFTRKTLSVTAITLLSLTFPLQDSWAQQTFAPDLSPGATELDCDDEDCAAVARGRAAFSKRNLHQLGGNGRSCADCHMPAENFQLTPAAAKTRFDALNAARVHNKNADDPLFRPVDADDFRTNGDNASDFSNLVQN